MRRSIFVCLFLVLCLAAASAAECVVDATHDPFNEVESLIQRKCLSDAASLLSQVCNNEQHLRCEYGWGRLYEERKLLVDSTNQFQRFLDQSEKNQGASLRRGKEMREYAKESVDRAAASLGRIRVYEKEKFKIDGGKLLAGPTLVWVSAPAKHEVQFLGAKQKITTTVQVGETRSVQRPANPTPSPVAAGGTLDQVSDTPPLAPTVDIRPLPAAPLERPRKIVLAENAVFLTTGLLFLTLGSISTGVCVTHAGICGDNPQALAVLGSIFGIGPGLSMSVVGIVGLIKR